MDTLLDFSIPQLVMLLYGIFVTLVLGLVAGAYIEVNLETGGYYLASKDGYYYLVDKKGDAFTDFLLENSELSGNGIWGRDPVTEKVTDGSTQLEIVGYPVPNLMKQLLFPLNGNYSFYACQDPGSTSGEWELYVRDQEDEGLPFSDTSDILTDGETISDISDTLSDISDTSSDDLGGINTETDISTTETGNESIIDTGLDTDTLINGGGESLINTDTVVDGGQDTLTDGLIDTNTDQAIDTNTDQVIDTNTDQVAIDTNTDQVVIDTNTDQVAIDTNTVAVNPDNTDGLEETTTAANDVLVTEEPVASAIKRFRRVRRRRTLKEQSKRDAIFKINYDMCFYVTLVLVDDGGCSASDCTPSCTTMCAIASCLPGSECPEMCYTNCPNDSCTTGCTKSLCNESGSCSSGACTTKCPPTCFTSCRPVTCTGCKPVCETFCVNDPCVTVCEAGCTTSGCSASCSISCPCSGSSCPGVCSGTDCPKLDPPTCTGTSCPKVGTGTCTGTRCPNVGPGTCTGLTCKKCTTCDQTVVFKGCPTCVHTFTDFVITCPSATTITISTCPNVNQCSPKILSLSPGTHTLSGTAVVPLKSDIVLTIKAAAATATGGTGGTGGTKSSGSGGSGNTSKGSTTGNSGGSQKDLVGTFFAAMAFFVLLW